MELKRLSKELLAEKMHRIHFRGHYYEMKVIVGLSSTSMRKSGNEIGKLFLRSKTTTERSLRTILKKLTFKPLFFHRCAVHLDTIKIFYLRTDAQ